MAKGHFEKLQGCGKPLSHAQSQNPYVDFTEHKINKILMDNGFTPEWITLQKEIRNDIDSLFNILIDGRSSLGNFPFNETDEKEWMTILHNQESRVRNINKNIDKYNLIVPILDQQICQIQLTRIAEKVIRMDRKEIKRKPNRKNDCNVVKSTDGNKSLLSSLLWWI